MAVLIALVQASLVVGVTVELRAPCPSVLSLSADKPVYYMNSGRSIVPAVRLTLTVPAGLAVLYNESADLSLMASCKGVWDDDKFSVVNSDRAVPVSAREHFTGLDQLRKYVMKRPWFTSHEAGAGIVIKPTRLGVYEFKCRMLAVVRHKFGDKDAIELRRIESNPVVITVKPPYLLDGSTDLDVTDRR